MGVLKRNMRDDAGHPRDDASFTDNGRQMDNFEDERGQARWHRRSAVARGVAKRGLVAFLAFAMAFGTTPAQMWADGAEGVAEALSQAVSSDDAGSHDAIDLGSTEQNGAAGAVSESGAASDSADASTTDGSSATAGDNSAASDDAQSSTSSVDEAGSATAATAARAEGSTKAADAAKKQVEVSFSIVGADADGKAQTWVSPTQLKLDEDATAADAFVKLVSLAGISADYDPATSYGFYLKSITSPYDGRTLAYDAASGAYWQLFVDGQSSMLGASSVKLTQGQKIEFAYTGEATAPTVKDQVAANVTVIGRDAQGNRQTWIDNSQYVVTSGSSALDLSKVAFEANDIDVVSMGAFILSMTHDGVELGTPADYSSFWQLFINGVSSDVMANDVTIHAGDTVTWFYGGSGDQLPSDSISASVQVLGKDKNGKQQVWASSGQVDLKTGSTAKDLLEQTGLTLDAKNESWGWFLNGITSPFDSSYALSSTPDWSSTWMFFVNGQMASVGAGDYVLNDGDTVTFMYGGYTDALPGQVLGSVDVIGPDVNGNNAHWGKANNVSLPEGSTAQDLIETVLKAKGLQYSAGTSKYDGSELWFLNTITSPFDGKSYGWDISTGNSWMLFINGESSSLCANNIKLKSGDKVTLAYTGYESEMPDPDKIVVDPSATAPDWDAEWSGYGNSGNGSAVTDAKTPSKAAGLAWAFDWKAETGQQYASCSEPVIANGFVYIATENELVKIDASTGKKVSSAPLASKVSYTSRPIYTNGLIIVPLSGGAVEAITADKLICKWLTPGLTDLTQSSCSIVSDGEYVYVGSVDIAYDENYNSTYGNGAFSRIKIATGEVSWQNIDPSEGYYWTGAALTDKYAVVPTSSGTLKCLDKTTGSVVSSMKLGALANADCIVDPSNGSTFYQMTHDGKLHVISLSAKGVLSEQETVDLGLCNNLSAPVVAGDKLIVGGQASSGSALVVYDLNTGKASTIASADGKSLPAGLNGIAATPLVSVQGNNTYVYFTVNGADTSDYVHYTSGGGVYRYKLGDKEATQIYDAAGYHQYCDSPVIADASGNLYYINDSGNLFKLRSVDSWTITFDSDGGSTVETKFASTMDGKLLQPTDPVREGYTFLGWYTRYGAKWDFSQPVSGDMTLIAKWQKNADKSDQGNGSTGGSGTGSGAGSGSGIAGSPSGSGTAGKQAGGFVAAKYAPVASTTKITKSDDAKKKDSKSSDDDSKKKSKSDSSKSSSDDKKSGKSSTRTVKTATVSASDAVRETTLNPFAIAGIAVGVIGLILIAVFVVTRRDKDGSNAR